MTPRSPKQPKKLLGGLFSKSTTTTLSSQTSTTCTSRATRAALTLAAVGLLLLLQPVAAHGDHPPVAPVTFLPYDNSAISYYGRGAAYRPNLCPSNITFVERARFLPELADNALGLFPSDLVVDGAPCRADALMLRFTAIGTPRHLPPQWIFEDSTLSRHPVNFTCGSERFSVRYAYLNDVKTPDGYLDPKVAYLDFAVIPNVHPFAFCAYRTTRADGKRPVDYAPFPTRKSWRIVQRRNDGQAVPADSAEPPESAEPSDVEASPESSAVPESMEEQVEEDDHNENEGSESFVPVQRERVQHGGVTPIVPSILARFALVGAVSPW